MHTLEVTWFKCSWTFGTIEVIIETGRTRNEEWCGNTYEIYIGLEIILECSFGEG